MEDEIDFEEAFAAELEMLKEGNNGKEVITTPYITSVCPLGYSGFRFAVWTPFKTDSDLGQSLPPPWGRDLKQEAHGGESTAISSRRLLPWYTHRALISRIMSDTQHISFSSPSLHSWASC